MVEEVKFKAQRCFEGQWEGFLMMGGWDGDAAMGCGESDISRHLQFHACKVAAKTPCPSPSP